MPFELRAGLEGTFDGALGEGDDLDKPLFGDDGTEDPEEELLATDDGDGDDGPDSDDDSAEPDDDDEDNDGDDDTVVGALEPLGVSSGVAREGIGSLTPTATAAGTVVGGVPLFGGGLEGLLGLLGATGAEEEEAEPFPFPSLLGLLGGGLEGLFPLDDLRRAPGDGGRVFAAGSSFQASGSTGFSAART